MKIDFLKWNAKRYKWTDVVHCEVHFHVNLGDLPFVVEGLLHIPFLSSGDLVNEVSYIFSFFPTEPCCLPKGSHLCISQQNSCGCPKKTHMQFITRVPKPTQILPLKPWPSQAKGSCKVVGVKNSNAARLLGLHIISQFTLHCPLAADHKKASQFC
jgi:hypothetical protein